MVPPSTISATMSDVSAPTVDSGWAAPQFEVGSDVSVATLLMQQAIDQGLAAVEHSPQPSPHRYGEMSGNANRSPAMHERLSNTTTTTTSNIHHQNPKHDILLDTLADVPAHREEHATLLAQLRVRPKEQQEFSEDTSMLYSTLARNVDALLMEFMKNDRRRSGVLPFAVVVDAVAETLACRGYVTSLAVLRELVMFSVPIAVTAAAVNGGGDAIADIPVRYVDFVSSLSGPTEC